jgi:hypothetical protein
VKRSAPLKRKVPLRANGGKARAEKLSPERRTEIARAGGMALREIRLASGNASVLNVKPRATMATSLAAEPPRPAAQKAQGRVRPQIRESARGEQCLIRLPGCPGDPAMTVWSHNRHQRAGKGGAMKALDLNGCYGCTWCDAVYDGQVPLPAGMSREQVELAWYDAHAESLVKLAQRGLIGVT